MAILICDPDKVWSSCVAEHFMKKGSTCEQISTGKECQFKVYKGAYHCLVLDLETADHSALEVLRYVRITKPGLKIVLTLKDKSKLTSLNMSKEDLTKLGASDILIKPFSIETLSRSISGDRQFEEWKKVTSTGNSQPQKEMLIKDSEVTRIKIDHFYSGNTVIFDHYARLGLNRYVKILHKGDFFDEKAMQKYSAEQKVEYLYFKTKDRATYLNFINELLSKVVITEQTSTQLKVKMSHVAVEKYIEEVYTTGLKPQLIDEGMKLCQNMYELVQKSSDLHSSMREFEEFDANGFSHFFLVSFLSTVISKNLPWASQRTTEIMALGSLLHDIGMLKLPANIRNKQPQQLNPEQLRIWKTHPKEGADMLRRSPIITEPVIQIVYQHHEYINGLGFPLSLSGSRIYPLAKVICLADYFADRLSETKLPPLSVLMEIIPNREIIQKFDPIIVKALVKGFIKEDK